jgi:hypothetical protein
MLLIGSNVSVVAIGGCVSLLQLFGWWESWSEVVVWVGRELDEAQTDAYYDLYPLTVSFSLMLLGSISVINPIPRK